MLFYKKYNEYFFIEPEGPTKAITNIIKWVHTRNINNYNTYETNLVKYTNITNTITNFLRPCSRPFYFHLCISVIGIYYFIIVCYDYYSK